MEDEDDYDSADYAEVEEATQEEFTSLGITHVKVVRGSAEPEDEGAYITLCSSLRDWQLDAPKLADDWTHKSAQEILAELRTSG